MKRLIIGLALFLTLSVGAFAADLGQSYRSGYCSAHETSDILTLQAAEIEQTVQRYYDQSVAELASEAVIVSTKPSFVWASEAKFACNKALGYFQGGVMDDESVQKCDCFFRRMTTYR